MSKSSRDGEMGQRRAKRNVVKHKNNSPTRSHQQDDRAKQIGQGTTGREHLLLRNRYEVQPGSYGMTREEYYRQLERKIEADQEVVDA